MQQALPRHANLIQSVKWTASVAQIFGYAFIAFDIVPWNIYMFLIGLVGWFSVGALWNDRAIILTTWSPLDR
ncbi:DUF6552 family protein [Thalassovita aquimarina]|uniref:DUF6552 family protein n=1 Tax=Thalassovita aquimarina TaxID=2785917 RepID=UPI00356946DF